tara:strand:- start:359 stop:571 length:213 start_codon:yes stop_codon:yes gene_type:complete
MMEQSARREIDVPAIGALKGHTNFEPSHSRTSAPLTHAKSVSFSGKYFNQKKKDLRATEREDDDDDNDAN